jgi:hypothetical protein
VLLDVGNGTKIEESEHKGVKYRQSMRSGSLANLTCVLTEDHISAIMQTVFNGTITNDKFCLSRVKPLPKMSARRDFPQEIQCPSETTEQMYCPKAESHEKTTVEHSTLYD